MIVKKCSLSINSGASCWCNSMCFKPKYHARFFYPPAEVCQNPNSIQLKAEITIVDHENISPEKNKF